MKFTRLFLTAALGFSLFAQPEGRRGDRLAKMAQELGLTEEQKSQIKPIFEEEAPKFKALREDQNMDRREKFEKIREIQQSTNSRIEPILTPEQQTKLKQMREEARGKRRDRRGDR